MSQHFTEQAQTVLKYAATLAHRDNNRPVSTGHILSALLQAGGIPTQILTNLGIQVQALAELLCWKMHVLSEPESSLKGRRQPYTAAAVLAIHYAEKEARRCETNIVGIEHLFFGLAYGDGNPEATSFQVLASLGLTRVEIVREQIMHLSGPPAAQTVIEKLPTDPTTEQSRIKSITVRRHKVTTTTPCVEVFQIEVECHDGTIWHAVAKTQGELDMFLEGLRAGVHGLPIPAVEMVEE